MGIVERVGKVAVLGGSAQNAAASLHWKDAVISFRCADLFKMSIAVLILAAALVSNLVAQEKKKPEWKDPAEYDLYKSITQTQDAKAWLETLDKWTKQYPQSEYADLRRQVYLAAYRQLGRPRDAFNAASDVLKDNPYNLVALSSIDGYIYQLTPPGPTELDTAEKASATILNNLDTIYSKDNRPAEMSDADTSKAKLEMRVFAQKTIGWIYFTRGDWQRAETELTKALELDPKQAQVSDWLGRAILAQNKTKPEKQPLALYQFARASSYEGPGSLVPNDRQQLQSYLFTSYKKYHGSDEGLTQLLAEARSSAMPPSGFTIKSAAQIEKEKIEAQKLEDQAHPERVLWRDVKAALTAPMGASYFESDMKDRLVPRLKGKLVSTTPAVKPKELVLAIENPAGDATLKIDGTLPGRMDPGVEIEFEGVAKSFSKDPFGVTFEVEKAKIAGWTGTSEAQKKNNGAKKSALDKKTL